MVFTDGYLASRGGWVRIGPGSQNLFEGPGRVVVERLALAVDATVIPRDRGVGPARSDPTGLRTSGC